MEEYFPKIIRIMPDYGLCYASDEEHCAFDVADLFENHPRFHEIQEIENQLYGLADWIDSGEADNNPQFPWKEFDKKGLELTKRLSQILKDIEIPIVYCIHYNNPRYAEIREIYVSDKTIA